MEESIKLFNNKIVLYKSNIKSRQYKNICQIGMLFPEIIIGDRFIYTQHYGNKVNIMSELVFNLHKYKYIYRNSNTSIKLYSDTPASHSRLFLCGKFIIYGKGKSNMVFTYNNDALNRVSEYPIDTIGDYLIITNDYKLLYFKCSSRPSCFKFVDPENGQIIKKINHNIWWNGKTPKISGNNKYLVGTGLIDGLAYAIVYSFVNNKVIYFPYASDFHITPDDKYFVLHMSGELHFYSFMDMKLKVKCELATNHNVIFYPIKHRRIKRNKRLTLMLLILKDRIPCKDIQRLILQDLIDELKDYKIFCVNNKNELTKKVIRFIRYV